MLNPQYFKIVVPAQITPEQLMQAMQHQFQDPDLESLFTDEKRRVVVAGRVLRFRLSLKTGSSGKTVVVGRGQWKRIALIVLGCFLFFPLSLLYFAISWGAACRFSRGIQTVVGGAADLTAVSRADAFEAPAVPAGGVPDYLKDLERLAALHEKGVLTVDEFAAEKQAILEQMGA